MPIACAKMNKMRKRGITKRDKETYVFELVWRRDKIEPPNSIPKAQTLLMNLQASPD